MSENFKVHPTHAEIGLFAIGVSVVANEENKLQDLASERAVLASLCQYGLDCYLDIDFVDSDHFTDDMNQVLFSCIHKTISDNAKVELTSILSAANSLGISDALVTKRDGIHQIFV